MPSEVLEGGREFEGSALGGIAPEAASRALLSSSSTKKGLEIVMFSLCSIRQSLHYKRPKRDAYKRSFVLRGIGPPVL